MEKNIISLLVSISALAISIIALSGKISFFPLPDIILTLVGICATIIVGVSVYDKIAIHSALKLYDTKLQELSEEMDKMSKLEQEMQRTKTSANILFHFTWGLVYRHQDSFEALEQFWRALLLSANSGDIARAKYSLNYAEQLVQEMASQEIPPKPKSFKIPAEVPETIIKSDVYCAFESRISKLLEDIHQLFNE